MSTNLRTSSLELDWNHQTNQTCTNSTFNTYRSTRFATGMSVGRNGISPSGMVVVFPPLHAVSTAKITVAGSASSSRHTFYDAIKRALDVIGASALLIVLSPLMALIAFAVRFDSKGPVIFSQRRLTVGGKVFTMLKFRTMKTDAESTTGAVWASKRDPRVTRVGKYLRLCRLDELPQLINVIRGEMSLIGPRPERPEIATDLSKDLPSFNHRLAVKAGITGLAQTTTGYASSVDSYRKKLAWDILYVRNRCLLLDLRIALKTIVVVLTGSGAR